MLQILVDAERCAVRGCTDICNMTFGKNRAACWLTRRGFLVDPSRPALMPGNGPRLR